MKGDRIAVGAALGLVAASLGLAVWVGRDGTSTAATAVTAADTVGPLIDDPAALTLANRAGAVLVGLAAQEGGPVDVFVYGDEERPLKRGTVRVSVNGEPPILLERGLCGRDCFRLDRAVLSGAPVTLAVQVERPGVAPEVVRLRLPESMPESATDLVAKAERTMLSIRSLRIVERLTAGGGTVTSKWAVQAPDRLRVRSSDGGYTVLIGKRRWDLVDGELVESPWTAERQPWYAWEGVRNARILGRERVDGIPVTVVSAFTPTPERWWFELSITADGRVLRERMLAPSHFMIDEFSGFDEPVQIDPPRS